jgi:hypothetical protein
MWGAELMAIKTRHHTEETMSLREFMDYAQAKVDFNDPDAFLALGEQLTMLGNNRQLLTDFFGDYIARHLHSDNVPGTISQAIQLDRRRDFYVRVAFWLPENEVTGQERKLYAYDQAHDHNFDLLSYAYCGSGYRTDIYEYDYASVVGYLGERVALEPLGNHQHRTGDCLFYRCSKDIHFQRPPDQPSITLNVIPLGNQHGLVDQYFFEIEGRDSDVGTLVRHADSNIENRKTLFDIAKQLPSPKISRVLADVVQSYACQRSRCEALRALRSCDPSVHDALCRRLEGDPSPLLRHYVLTSASARA